MDDREYCLKRRRLEGPKFVKVMQALPEGRLDYRPEPRARTAAELAWLIAAEEDAILGLLESGTLRLDALLKPSGPPPLAEIVATYERSHAALNERLEKLDAAGWEARGRFVMGEVSREQKICDFVWGFLFDAVHHRGQLSTYLRPMGGKVPSIYGPSGDDKGPL